MKTTEAIEMISLMKNWKGEVEVNGVHYNNISEVKISDLNDFDNVTIHLLSAVKKSLKSSNSVLIDDDKKQYRITVKQYMTKPASPDFDFMKRWNNDIPMPMRIMQGTVEKETRGMVYMKLHGFARQTITCACCGKELTNPVSRYYGIGPICLAKLGIARQIDDIDNIKEDLAKIEWSGWVIKSSLLEFEEIS